MTIDSPIPTPPDTLFLSDRNIGALHDWKAAVEALRSAYSQPFSKGMVPPRSMARGDGLWLRGLSAVAPGGRYMGCKLIAASMKNRQASYLVALFDQNSTQLLSLMDGNQITGIRTAATSAVAIDALVVDAPLRVALIGSGFEARAQLAALLTVRKPESVRVYSPTPEKRQKLADDFRDQLGSNIAAADDPSAIVADANLVICATRSRNETPVLQGSWLKPGTTVVSIGSTLPEQREVDTDVLLRADRVVADMVHEVVFETGDGIAASAACDLQAKTCSLADIMAGRTPGRAATSDIVVYKSVGSALQDVVTAAMLYERAIELEQGTALQNSIVPIKK